MKIGSLENLYLVDEKKATDGIELELDLNEKEEPMVLIVAAMHAKNPLWEKTLRKYEKPRERARHSKKKRTRVWARIIAESILKDWRGILDENGNEEPATLDSKIEALIKYPVLIDDVMETAQSMDRYRPDDLDELDEDDAPDDAPDDPDIAELTPEEDTEKNLQSSSAGTSDTVVS